MFGSVLTCLVCILICLRWYADHDLPAEEEEDKANEGTTTGGTQTTSMSQGTKLLHVSAAATLNKEPTGATGSGKNNA